MSNTGNELINGTGNDKTSVECPNCHVETWTGLKPGAVVKCGTCGALGVYEPKAEADIPAFFKAHEKRSS